MPWLKAGYTRGQLPHSIPEKKDHKLILYPYLKFLFIKQVENEIN